MEGGLARSYDRGDRRNIAVEIMDGARVLREQWWLVALCVVVGALGAYAYSRTEDPVYQSTARVLLLQSDPNATALQGNGVFTDPARERATDIELVQQPAVAEGAAKRLGIKTSAGQLLPKISTSIQGDSNVLSITSSTSRPQASAPLANAFAASFIAFERRTQEKRYRQALDLVNSRIKRLGSDPDSAAELERLQAQKKDLSLLASLQTGNVQMIEQAGGPGFETGVATKRDVLVGALLGLLVGLGVAFLRDRLDPRLKTEEQVLDAFPGVPVIGSIPRIRNSVDSRRAAAERFHLLRADIAAMDGVTRDASFLLVTSAMPGEGKSSTAVNLALAIQESGERVTLVEADLRAPELSRLTGKGRPGMTAVLRGSSDTHSVTSQVNLAPRDSREGPRLALKGRLPFIPAGDMGGDYREILNGPTLERFLSDLARRSDAVVIDGPPLGLFSDVSRLARMVDRVIVVVRLGHTRRRALRRLHDQLARAEIVPAGLVVTGGAIDAAQYGRYG
jgi:Mrp family chromosome partitioning ATPase